MGRILSIDYGAVRIGLALTDPSKIIASPLKVVKAEKDLLASCKMLLSEMNSYDIEKIVLGLPLLLSGKDSETTSQVREFASLLEKESALPVILWDERLSSKQVERILIEGNVKRKKRGKHVDTMSATLILQSYLASPSC